MTGSWGKKIDFFYEFVDAFAIFFWENKHHCVPDVIFEDTFSIKNIFLIIVIGNDEIVRLYDFINWIMS